MIGLLQRVVEARVRVDGKVVAEIGVGLLVLVAVEGDDRETEADRLIERLIRYRVFPDDRARMNLSLADISGGLLLVPQFTLAADTSRGLRPSFSRAAQPERAERLFERAVYTARQLLGERVAAGTFGADMQVQLTNDGPVTFWLEVSPSS
jgi:D-tyrosyl-tRNA(Tyr) deacylase